MVPCELYTENILTLNYTYDHNVVLFIYES